VRFVHVYLIGYFVLVTGAVLALWQSGALARVGGAWLVVAIIAALGLGVVLGVTSATPTTTRQ
jgi:hypothetical protein